jgi:hypothetical protein
MWVNILVYRMVQTEVANHHHVFIIFREPPDYPDVSLLPYVWLNPYV